MHSTPSTTYPTAFHNFPMHTTNTKYSWQNGTRCRNGVKLMWCYSHLVWRVPSLHALVFNQKTFVTSFIWCRVGEYGVFDSRGCPWWLSNRSSNPYLCPHVAPTRGWSITNRRIKFYWGEKSWGVYSSLDNGLFLKNQTTFGTKRSAWPSSMMITVDLEYCLLLSVAWMFRFWFKSLQNSTVHKRSLVQGSLFLLAVYTYDVPLYLCTVFSSHRQVRLSIASYCVWSANHTPFCTLSMRLL